MKSLILSILILASSLQTFAAEDLSYDATKVWVAPPVSFFVGFGAGHGLQDRYSDYGWAYTIADSVGFFLIFLTMGDCPEEQGSCQEYNKTMGGFGQTTLLISRLAQVIDTSRWAYKYEEKFPSQAFILPKNDGAVVGYVWKF